jgi:pimeloyl-ACP methyl ester carboxylesterase
LRAAIGHTDARQLDAVLRLGAPTTLAWSGDDRVLTGRWTREGFAHLPAGVVELPDVGNLPLLDNLGLVAELITSGIAGTAADAS